MGRVTQNKGDKQDLLTLIQCISQVSRSVGNKLQKYFKTIVQQLSVFPAELEDNESVDIDNEICEACLIAIDSLIRKCSGEAR